MDKARKDKKKTIAELIDEAAERGAEKSLRRHWNGRNANRYRTMEWLLREYKKHRFLMEHPEEFEFFPIGKSKDISIAPPKGSGVVDRIDLTETYVEGRKDAFKMHVAGWYMADRIIPRFEDREEFIAIRMFYFNEDAAGADRGPNARRYSFEDISEELAKIGISRTPRTLRNWRTKLVQEMTVLLFGVEGALSIEDRDKPNWERGEQAAPVDLKI